MEDRDAVETVETSGRDLVREVLVGRIEDAGLTRPRGLSVERFTEMKGRLAQHLAYMDRANLETLAEVVIDHAGGKSKTECPAEVVIRQLAHALQPQPFEEKRIVRSWLASVEGPQAEAGGYLVELFRFLRRAGRPPMAYDMQQLREEARQNNRTVVMIRERIERGTAQPADCDWLSAYLADQQAARRIVDRGAQGRAGQ